MYKRKHQKSIKALLHTFPKERLPLPQEYELIFERHYRENREASTNASRASQLMEQWGHKMVAKSKKRRMSTLEIGAGTLNQLRYENGKEIYDVVEPRFDLYKTSRYKSKINAFYDDISQIPKEKMYDRITSCYTFEHILDLPNVIRIAGEHLNKNGVLAVAIPNEGRFLWRFAYKHTTGREFRKRYGLDYEVIMRYEHVNTADEIEALLNYYFKIVELSLMGISRDLAFYRFYLCKDYKFK